MESIPSLFDHSLRNSMDDDLRSICSPEGRAKNDVSANILLDPKDRAKNDVSANILLDPKDRAKNDDLRSICSPEGRAKNDVSANILLDPKDRAKNDVSANILLDPKDRAKNNDLESICSSASLQERANIDDWNESTDHGPFESNDYSQKWTATLHYKKKRLIDAVKGLTKEEHIEIFKIFLNHQENYSENNNGIFINLNSIKESIIDQILKYIEYMNVKKSDLIQEEMKKETNKQLLGDCSKVVVNNFDIQKPLHQEYEFQDDHASITNVKINEFLKFLNPTEIDPSKITLKRKKNKYHGSTAKMINSFKEPKETSLSKNNQHKSYNSTGAPMGTSE